MDEVAAGILDGVREEEGNDSQDEADQGDHQPNVADNREGNTGL